MNSNKVDRHYDAISGDYSAQHERDKIFSSDEYPGNYFRLQLVLNSMTRKGVKSLVEIGVGEGTPLKCLMESGIEV